MVRQILYIPNKGEFSQIFRNDTERLWLECNPILMSNYTYLYSLLSVGRKYTDKLHNVDDTCSNIRYVIMLIITYNSDDTYFCHRTLYYKTRALQGLAVKLAINNGKFHFIGSLLTNTPKYIVREFTNHLPVYVSMGLFHYHYSDVMMSMPASQITSLTIVYWTVYLGPVERQH